VSILVVAVLAAYVKYRSFWDSIKRVDVTGLIGKQPPKYNNAVNILLIGSDTRTGQGGIGGNAPGCNCSDTLMLLHIPPRPHHATVMSLPPATIFPILAFAASGGASRHPVLPGQLQRINPPLPAIPGLTSFWRGGNITSMRGHVLKRTIGRLP